MDDFRDALQKNRNDQQTVEDTCKFFLEIKQERLAGELLRMFHVIKFQDYWTWLKVIYLRINSDFLLKKFSPSRMAL